MNLSYKLVVFVVKPPKMDILRERDIMVYYDYNDCIVDGFF